MARQIRRPKVTLPLGTHRHGIPKEYASIPLLYFYKIGWTTLLRVPDEQNPILLFGLAYLGQILNRANATIRYWEWIGLIPRPLFELPKRHRWYTGEEVIMYEDFFNLYPTYPKYDKQAIRGLKYTISKFQNDFKDGDVKLRDYIGERNALKAEK